MSGNKVNGDIDGKSQKLLLVLELDSDADADEAERLGRQLRSDLTQLDIDTVEPVTSASAPEGAKGTGTDWASLLVTLSGPGAALTSVIAVVRDWLARHSAAQGIKITIDNDTIELGRASVQEREELIGTWLHRHSTQ